MRKEKTMKTKTIAEMYDEWCEQNGSYKNHYPRVREFMEIELQQRVNDLVEAASYIEKNVILAIELDEEDRAMIDKFEQALKPFYACNTINSEVR